MTKKIYVLLDYKDRFNTKNIYANPYMSGFDKRLLEMYFREQGYETVLVRYAEIDFREINFKDQYVLYQSSEDRNLHYKSYIEDILLGLQLQGAILIPDFYVFRAHHNKVFMEILRDIYSLQAVKNIRTHCFGTYEDFVASQAIPDGKLVLKQDAGAMSTGVFLANDKADALKSAQKISKTRSLKDELRNFARAIKHKGYKRDSWHRRKFVVQNFIPDLNDDWKVLVYGTKYYILNRQVRDNDFRASGSGKFAFLENIPEGTLDFAQEIFNYLKVPNLSLDIAYDGRQFYLLEFQAIHFGTATIERSPFYFELNDNTWNIVHEKSILEREYAYSIVKFIDEKFHV